MTPLAVRVQLYETTTDGVMPNLHATCKTFTHTIAHHYLIYDQVSPFMMRFDL
jgi:hypothetical protein